MRLTADVLLRAECIVNPTKDRELNLRGFKIPIIENLAVLQDQVDVADLSDNDISVVENFPKMPRMTTLLLTSNSVNRINASQNLATNLPNLTSLILTNNKVASFTEVYNIAVFKKLEVLSLMENPVSMLQNYRNYIVYKMPSLKLLDFVKIKRVERESVAKWAKSKDGKAFIAQVQADAITVNAAAASVTTASSSSAGGGIGAAPSSSSSSSGHAAAPTLSSFAAVGGAARSGAAAVKRVYSEDEKRQIREAVEAASTPAEMDAIEKQLKTGSFKFSNGAAAAPVAGKRKASAAVDEDSRDSSAAKSVRLNGDSK